MMRTSTPLALLCARYCFFLLPFSFSASTLAQASSQSKAIAEALFDEGIALMKASDYAKACPKLESSQRVEPAVGTLLYLGECYARVERTASAWATFREASSLATESGQTERAAQAKARAEELEPKLAYLTISAAPAVRDLAGVVILRRGEKLDPSALGTALPVDPGKIKVEVNASGYVPFTASIEVTPQNRAAVEIPALKPLPNTYPTAVATTNGSAMASRSQSPSLATEPTSASPEKPSSTQRIVGVVVMGAGVAGLGVGTYFGLRAMSQDSKADSGYCNATICQRESDLDYADNARKNATISNIAFGAGAGAILVGIVTYFLAPSRTNTGLSITPQLAQGQLGVSVGTRLQ